MEKRTTNKSRIGAYTGYRMVYVSDMVESVFFFPFNHNRCYFVAPLSLGIFSFRRRVGSKLGVFFLSLTFFFFLLFAFSSQQFRRISFPGGTPTAQLLLPRWPQSHVSASIMLLVSKLVRSIGAMPFPSVVFRCFSLPFVAFRCFSFLDQPFACSEGETGTAVGL